MAENTNKICANQYTVKRGDSFYLISHRLGIPLRSLLEANPTINPARLMIGDVLCIPMEETNQHVPQTPVTPTPVTPTPVTPSETQAETQEETPAPAPSETPAETTPEPAPEAPAETTPAPATTPPCPESVQVTVTQGQTLSDIQLEHNINLHTLELANPSQDLSNLATGQVLCVPGINLACALPDTYCIADGESLESVAVKYNLPLASLLRANPCLAPGDFTSGTCIALPK